MSRDYELKAGMFLAIALVIFIVSIYMLGQERQIFSRQVEYFTEFTDVQGLSEGAPVRLGGISIGRVAQIGFVKNAKEPTVQVSLLINANYTERIHKDSTAAIETQGLLGDKFLAISAGKEAEPLAPGSMIRSIPPANFNALLDKAALVVNNTVQAAENMNKLLEEFRAQTFDDLKKTTANVAEISERIKTGPGTIHSLLYSEEKGGDLIDNLEAASQSIRSIAEEVKNGRGILHALVYDARGRQTIDALRKAAAGTAKAIDHVRAMIGETESGPGLLHELIYGESPKLHEIFENLSRLLRNLNQASEALAKGSGTLGALLIDSRLYDNLIEVTDDAKRSIILRHAIRSSLEEGAAAKPPSGEARR